MEERVPLMSNEASTNLSEQVDALLRARREHAAATADAQVSLLELEGKLEKVKDANKSLTSQKNKLITRMCIKECERDERIMRAHKLKKETIKYTTEDVNVSSQIRLKQEEIIRSQKTYTIYIERMDAYKTSVEKFDRSLPEIKAVKTAREKLDKLREDRNRLQREMNLLSGSREDQWKEAMADIRNELKELETNLEKKRLLHEQTKSRLLEKHKERKDLETANMILKKRNTAILTRLKRRAESQKQKFHRLTNHIKIVAGRLSATRARLERMTEQ